MTHQLTAALATVTELTRKGRGVTNCTRTISFPSLMCSVTWQKKKKNNLLLWNCQAKQEEHTTEEVTGDM
jgi:hypothetical protein